MSEQLRFLVELQYLEDKKAAYSKSRQGAPQQLTTLDQEFSRFEGEVVLKKAELEHTQKIHRAVEQEIADLAAKLKRTRSRMSEIKNNREYQATLKEIEDRQKEISDREDHALELMETLESLNLEVKALDRDLTRRKAELARQKQQIEQDGGQVEARIAHLESLQQQVLKRLDPELHQRWQLILQRQGTTAVTAVEHGICRSCHLNLPPQKLIELQRDREIMFCPHCHRFIYWPDHEQYSMIRDDYENL
ncbi:MAG: hypothetical protein AUK55_02765 [Syntrophobacteraceae bacterium CG2_30_61_12]|nr:MAG: hypothetical protein AUK55_02765 [Syntrophobacteraceae bacterium CG2_30_61_12]